MKAIDLFSGLGGFTLGATWAGWRVLWAANHWRAAYDCHAANHPETEHACQDLHQANWELVPSFDFGLASPACQGHSKARGADRPHHDAARSTAWAVVSCAEFHRPYGFVVENVVEFLNWTLFPAWRAAMEALGYTLSPHVLDAADHGVPQNRQRVFIVCTRSKAPLVLDLPKLTHVPFRTILEPGGEWSSISSKCEATRARVANGRREHGNEFLIAYYGTARGGRSLARPLGTVTTRDRYAIVNGPRMRMLTVGEYRAAMSFPASYRLPANRKLAKHLLGNAVCPVQARDICQAITAAL